MLDTTIRARRAVIDGRLRDDVTLRITNGHVAAIESSATVARCDEALEVEGILLPGLVDIQVNGMGGAGFDATDDAAFDRIARAVAVGGAAAFLPTLISAPLDAMAERASRVARWLTREHPAEAATPLGLHLEGPFLELAGAHDEHALVAPTPQRVDRLIEACAGTLRLVTLAPGLPGAADAVARLRRAGVQVAIGHARTTDGFLDCVDAGAQLVTHLFNAMSPIHHRDPGIALLALDEPRLTCCLIADGHHVHPKMLRLAWQLLGPSRTVLVTDAVGAAGMPDGAYELSGIPVTSSAGVVRDRAGVLAGSALSMREACERFMRFVPGVDAANLAAIAATNPARLIGAKAFGAIEVGSRAAFAELRTDASVRAVLTTAR